MLEMWCERGHRDERIVMRDEADAIANLSACAGRERTVTRCGILFGPAHPTTSSTLSIHLCLIVRPLHLPLPSPSLVTL